MRQSYQGLQKAVSQAVGEDVFYLFAIRRLAVLVGVSSDSNAIRTRLHDRRIMPRSYGIDPSAFGIQGDTIFYPANAVLDYLGGVGTTLDVDFVEYSLNEPADVRKVLEQLEEAERKARESPIPLDTCKSLTKGRQIVRGHKYRNAQ